MTIKNILCSPITIDVYWKQEHGASLDLTAFLLNESGQISDIFDMAFYGTKDKLKSTSGITLKKENNVYKRKDYQSMTINLERLSENIKSITIAVSNSRGKSLDKFKEVEVVLRDNNKFESSLQIDDNGDNVCCVSVDIIQKKGGTWRSLLSNSIGYTGYAGGLEMAYEDYVPKEIRDKNPFNQFKYPSESIAKDYVEKNLELTHEKQNVAPNVAISEKNGLVGGIMPPTKVGTKNSLEGASGEVAKSGTRKIARGLMPTMQSRAVQIMGTTTSVVSSSEVNNPITSEIQKKSRGKMPQLKSNKN